MLMVDLMDNFFSSLSVLKNLHVLHFNFKMTCVGPYNADF